MNSKQRRQGSEKQMGSMLLKGAVVLGLATIVSKLIGTMQKIPLQNMAGDAVFGIYNAVYPLYILILFLATAGFPLVVSKFVSEQVAMQQYEEAKRVLKVASYVLITTGIACFLLLFYGADWLAELMGAKQTGLAIRSVSFALLLVPIMSALRGYYQGYQNMIPTAVSQVIEQTVRVATMFGLLLLFMHWGYGAEWVAAGATFGSVTGAAAGLMVMLVYYRKDRHKENGRKQSEEGPDKFGENKTSHQSDGSYKPQSRESDWSLVRRLLLYALPICLGTISLPILTLVDSFTLPRLLKLHGLDETGALYQFGLYNHGMPLVQLVAMIASSMSAALVPSIAAAKLLSNQEILRNRSSMALRLTWVIGLAASVGLSVLAEPLNVMFYKSADGSLAMSLLSYTALFSTINIIAGSVLQGFGAVVAPALYLLAAAAVKIAANAALVPHWGIDGAALAAVGAYALAGLLALAHALRATGVTPAVGRAVIKPLLCVGLMAASLLAVTHGLPALLGALPVALPSRGTATVVALAGVAVGALVYLLALVRLGVISAAELEQIPKLRGKPLALLRKVRLLR
ncbi:Membrane protein involved in the export of O-antigen and teichoic acid [Paenibacillus sp. 1_12]|uniref:putative polysaccharide biosynthesis protein n=1 Tax=Paenibacillus sp. 1_12 TaxID=1566278 RepID=UPI0008ED41F4|nr:polysaccharide biosynthesis protein [Paenibacillus sp. 1_12]SFM31811.1 Membrane protein involved in the export of O-antigen and teichoic acid [Paenibacillus sp. 1_12]